MMTSNESEIGRIVERQFEDHRRRHNRRVLKCVALVLIGLIFVSLYLMTFEVEDSVTTLTGKYHSWTRSPYYATGMVLLIISWISLVAVAIALRYCT